MPPRRDCSPNRTKVNKFMLNFSSTCGTLVKEVTRVRSLFDDVGFPCMFHLFYGLIYFLVLLFRFCVYVSMKRACGSNILTQNISYYLRIIHVRSITM